MASKSFGQMDWIKECLLTFAVAELQMIRKLAQRIFRWPGKIFLTRVMLIVPKNWSDLGRPVRTWHNSLAFPSITFHLLSHPPSLQDHMDKTTQLNPSLDIFITEDDVARQKKKFNNISLPKQSYSDQVVDSAQEMVFSLDHALIANCLDFMDSEAQVSTTKLSLNLLYYLPTLYFFDLTRPKKPNLWQYIRQSIHLTLGLLESSLRKKMIYWFILLKT